MMSTIVEGEAAGKIETMTATQSATQNIQSHAQRIEEVKRYIRGHVDEPLQRTDLARMAGFSVVHLHRLFIACSGQSIAAYVRGVRMQRAGHKLRMGAVDITEVALAAGYHTHTAFSKAFKRHFGLAPSDFRQLSCRAATQLLRNRD